LNRVGEVGDRPIVVSLFDPKVAAVVERFRKVCRRKLSRRDRTGTRSDPIVDSSSGPGGAEIAIPNCPCQSILIELVAPR
jgi:hypothetical protein